MKITPFKYWGYLYASGRLQVRIYLDQQDIIDMENNPHVVQLVYPFEAESRDKAREYIEEKINTLQKQNNYSHNVK